MLYAYINFIKVVQKVNKSFDTIDILTFFENEDTRLSDAALSKALKQFNHYERYWFFRYDVDKEEIFYLFPLNCVNRLEDKKSDFIAVLRKEWKNAGFEICEQKEMPPSTYFQISIYTLFFCLKRKE